MTALWALVVFANTNMLSVAVPDWLGRKCVLGIISCVNSLSSVTAIHLYMFGLEISKHPTTFRCATLQQQPIRKTKHSHSVKGVTRNKIVLPKRQPVISVVKRVTAAQYAIVKLLQ